jgi:segregation and condensation protein B
MKTAIVEGLLFIRGDLGVSEEEILTLVKKEELEEVINKLNDKYALENSGLTLKKYGNLYKLTTKEEYSSYYEKFFDDPKNMNLSNSLLEVLSIITFEGPITVKSIEKIRGISSREQVRRLKSLDLIEEAGRSEELGHATLYKITNNFLDFFGIENLKEIKDEQTNI